jgi:DNA-binding MarR family transcriptional regulator
MSEYTTVDQILAQRRRHPPITPKEYAAARGITENGAVRKFKRLFELGVTYVWREGKPTDRFPDGKQLLMDGEIFAKVVARQFKLPA